MEKLSIAAVLGLSVALLVSGIAAVTETAMGNSQFDVLDLNRDGQLSVDEVSKNSALIRRWIEFDTDESGTISRIEFSAFEAAQGSDIELLPSNKGSAQ